MLVTILFSKEKQASFNTGLSEMAHLGPYPEDTGQLQGLCRDHGWVPEHSLLFLLPNFAPHGFRSVLSHLISTALLGDCLYSLTDEEAETKGPKVS